MNILEEIAGRTRIRIEERKKERPFEELLQRVGEGKNRQSHSFYQALNKEGVGLICEVKKASPSKGLIVEDFPYVGIAKEYEEAGAVALSVLTEPYYFKGRDEYLSEIAGETALPILRKDFTIDEYMLYEAVLMGASAVLLICSLLGEKELSEYLNVSRRLGLAALVEAHDENEVDMAVAVGADIVGVNNRNLKTFQVDLATSERLRKRVPDATTFVSESGIATREDVRRLRDIGVDAVLVGETLMRSKDKKAALAELSNESQ